MAPITRLFLLLSVSFLMACGDTETETSATQEVKSVERVIPPAPTPDPVPLNVSSNYVDEVMTSELLLIQFDQALDARKLTYNSAAGPCEGQIQVSSDGFVSCLGLQYFSVGTKKLELRALNLLSDIDYQLKVTTSVKSLLGNSLEQDYISDFKTISSAGLLITEIGAAPYTDGQTWFEIYNTTNHSINLSSYKLVSSALFATCDRAVGTCSSTNFLRSYGFALPNKDIAPGQYHIIRGHSWYENYQDSAQVSYVGSSSVHLYWDAFGYIDLRLKGSDETEDFVRFGDWGTTPEIQPSASVHWSGANGPALPYSNSSNDYGNVLVRKNVSADNNQASDWALLAYQTPGGPNDVSCNTDLDSDGLPDCSEVEGATYAGIDIYALGARQGQADIFIELDYMTSADDGVTPHIESLQKVVNAFALQGVAVHFDVGDLFDQTPGVINLEKFDLGGGNSVPFNTAVGFDPTDVGIDNFYDIKRQNMDYARLSIFHYMLMANSQNADGSGGSGGIAEVNGNDSIITLGGWGLSSSDLNRLINNQSATIMHELGHNLGLLHGGDDGVNFKPNYVSIMNYLYAIHGLPRVTNNEGDRYLHEECAGPVPSNSEYSDPNDFRIDFSYGGAANINEGQVDEQGGLGFVMSEPVDFNCSGAIDADHYGKDLNRDNKQEILSDHDDWNNLNLKFQRSYNSNEHFSGAAIDGFVLQDVQVGNDRTNFIIEDDLSH